MTSGTTQMMETYGIAVFDVCGTITKTNNTSAFIGFVLARNSMLRYGPFVLIRMLSSLLGFLGIHSIRGRDRLRDWQIALLRGCCPARIEEMSELYVDDLFRKGLLNDTILEAIKQEAEEGRTLYLVSAAIDPPVAAIARRFNIENCFSSELEIENGHYTGRLKTDLLGDKESILKRIPAYVDLRDCSVYSDNPEDSVFMTDFGRPYVVLNTSQARKRWNITDDRFHFITGYDTWREDRDIHSVNEGIVKWTYVPTLYYVISRFHRAGVLTLLVREIVPVTLAGLLFTNLSVFSLFLMPVSFVMFYSIYEIGGLVNDLAAHREAPGQNTQRIAPRVHIYTGLFVAIRVAAVGFILALLPIGTYPVLVYAEALCLCLGIYLVHTLLLGNLRVLTFILLKFCRNSIPLLILVSHVTPMTLAWLCAIFFVIDAPWRVYAYLSQRGLVKAEIPVWRVRCMNTAALCGLGAVIYLAGGPFHLLAIASYGVALECLWIIQRAWSHPIGWFSAKNP